MIEHSYGTFLINNPKAKRQERIKAIQLFLDKTRGNRTSNVFKR